MVSAIAVMVIFVSLLAGCQKEKEEEMSYIKVINDSYKPIRLKSGSEGDGSYKCAQVIVSSTVKNEIVTVIDGKYYKIEVKGNMLPSTIKVTGNNLSEEISANNDNYNVGTLDIIVTGNQNVTVTYVSGSAGTVSFYEYY